MWLISRGNTTTPSGSTEGEGNEWMFGMLVPWMGPFCRIEYSGSILHSLTLQGQPSVPDGVRGQQGL